MPAGPSPPSALVTVVKQPVWSAFWSGDFQGLWGPGLLRCPRPSAQLPASRGGFTQNEVSLEDIWMNGDLGQESRTLAGAEGATLVSLVPIGFNSAD